MPMVIDPGIDEDTDLSLVEEPEIPCDNEHHGIMPWAVLFHDRGPAKFWVEWEPCPKCGKVVTGFRCAYYVQVAYELPDSFETCCGTRGRLARATPI